MLPRHILSRLLESLQNFPVVLLTGARQVGKSTLARAIAAGPWPARYLTLDERTTLDAALQDPDGFLHALGPRVVIDEVQRAPELMRAVKLIVDRDRRPGMYFLTGSANVSTLSSVSETLAGRVAVHALHPFSWAEKESCPAPATLEDSSNAADARDLLERWPTQSPAHRASELREHILSGGYPTPAMMTSKSARAVWFDSYRQTYLERDLRDLAHIEHLPDFGRLMSSLALRSGQLLNASGLSRDIALPLTTLRRYLRLLEQTYQVVLVPPHHGNLEKRLVKTPKFYMTDTGFACALSAVEDWPVLVRQNRAGAMLETWAAGELSKLMAIGAPYWRMSFWRTRAGQEVDFLLERGERVFGIEVKSSSGVDRRDLEGLSRCRNDFGKRWGFGLLLHGGTETVGIDDRTIAVPFGAFFGRDAR